MAVGALGAVATVAVAGLWLRPGSPARAPTAHPTARAISEAVLGTAPPPLQLQPRLRPGSVLGDLRLGGTALQVLEGLAVTADQVGHDDRTAYPGEPHTMVLVAGRLISAAPPSPGADLTVTTSFGHFTYRVAAVGPRSTPSRPDGPGLRLLLTTAAVDADLVPGDPLTAAELQEEVAIAGAEQKAQAEGLPGAAAGQLLAPLRGTVTQLFGPSPYGFELPFTYRGVYYPHFHTGLDIGAPTGTPVGAAAAGVVVLATTNLAGGAPVGFGTYVLLSHGGGLYTLYGHLSALAVRAGDSVQAGQEIGLAGTTGNSTGPHLHFEVRRGDLPVDPAPLLGLTAG